MPRVSPPVHLEPDERVELVRWRNTPSTPQKYLSRIDIVLLAADGLSNQEIITRGIGSKVTTAKWRRRYIESGRAGLEDAPRPGRPTVIDQEMATQILELVTSKAPEGRTHWSQRLLADVIGISQGAVGNFLHEHGIQPHRTETFKYSKDPELKAKVVDIVGLYLNPPERGLVISVDEKTQLQALDRTQATLPVRPGSPERRTHDYVRHGTKDLFAAMEVATGEVFGECHDRHTSADFLNFLKSVRKNWPYRTLHIICDNLSAHKSKKVKAWVAKRPRIKLHFTPTSASWMNQVECWFSILQRQMVNRGRHGSKKELAGKLLNFIDEWNRRKHPFVWKKTADQILKKAIRKATN